MVAQSGSAHTRCCAPLASNRTACSDIFSTTQERSSPFQPWLNHGQRVNSGASTSNIGCMDVLAAPEWHFWIAVVLAPLAILQVGAMVVGYFFKVVYPRYPKRYQKRQ